MNKIQARPLSFGIPIYEGFDSLDVAGPYQVFGFLNNEKQPVMVKLIGPKKDQSVTSTDGIRWLPDYGYDDAPEHFDVLFVPGGVGGGYNALLQKNLNDPFFNFIISRAATVQLLTAVCTGSILLAKTKLLDGYTCTTHWAFKNSLSLFPNVIMAPGFPRYVIDRNRVTGGGISSGIDEAFAIAEILRGPEAAKLVQLKMQYAPNPPYQSGDPSVASATAVYKASTEFSPVTNSVYNILRQELYPDSKSRKG
ncbi:MAG: DJ-1/PfpI family protein [Saprospiraceae bacterium]